MKKTDAFDFSGKNILIVGGTGRIGTAISRAFVQRNGNVIIVGLNRKKGERIARNLKATFMQGDISKPTDVRSLLSEILHKFHTVDVLVNCSLPKGRTYGKPFEDITYKYFCENTNMHLGGFYELMKEVAMVMKIKQRGKIINFASIYGMVAPTFSLYKNTSMVNPVEYAAIKNGIIGLTKYLASYYGKYNIQVNCISPGGVYNRQPAQFVRRYNAKVPLGRMANPEDLVGGVLFLASPLSDYVTGHNLVIDGGFTIL